MCSSKPNSGIFLFTAFQVDPFIILEFVVILARYLQSKGAMSPGLLQLRTNKKRDLQSILAEERRGVKVTAAAPLAHRSSHASLLPTRILNSVLGPVSTAVRLLQQLFPHVIERPTFVNLENNFVLLTESSGAMCPVWKEYKNSDNGTKYPVLSLDCKHGASPFLSPDATSGNAAIPAHPPLQKPTNRKQSVPLLGGMLTRSKARLKLGMENNTSAAILRASATMTVHNWDAANRETAFKPSILTLMNPAIQNDEEKENTRPYSPCIERRATRGDAKGNLAGSEDEEVKPIVFVNPLLVKAQTAKESKPNRPRPGYCECCAEKYAELEKHVRSIPHRQYAINEENYNGIDDLLRYIVRPSIVMQNANNVSSQSSEASSRRDAGRILLSPISNNSNSLQALATKHYTLSKRLRQTEALRQINLQTTTTEDVGDPSSPSIRSKTQSTAKPEGMLVGGDY